MQAQIPTTPTPYPDTIAAGRFVEPPPVFVAVPLKRSVQAAYQRFERGHMVWLNTEPPVIWTFDANGVTLEYRDAWSEGELAAPSPVKIPEGRMTPVRGFGALWKGNSQIRSALGFALAPEQGYDARIGFAPIRCQ